MAEHAAALPEVPQGQTPASSLPALWQHVAAHRRLAMAQPLSQEAWGSLAATYAALSSAWDELTHSEAQAALLGAEADTMEVWLAETSAGSASPLPSAQAGGPRPSAAAAAAGRGAGGVAGMLPGCGMVAAMGRLLAARAERALVAEAAAAALSAASQCPPPALSSKDEAAAEPQDPTTACSAACSDPEALRKLAAFSGHATERAATPESASAAPSACPGPDQGTGEACGPSGSASDAASLAVTLLLGPAGRIAASAAAQGLASMRANSGLFLGLDTDALVAAAGLEPPASGDSQEDATDLSAGSKGPLPACIAALRDGTSAAAMLLAACWNQATGSGLDVAPPPLAQPSGKSTPPRGSVPAAQNGLASATEATTSGRAGQRPSRRIGAAAGAAARDKSLVLTSVDLKQATQSRLAAVEALQDATSRLVAMAEAGARRAAPGPARFALHAASRSLARMAMAVRPAASLVAGPGGDTDAEDAHTLAAFAGAGLAVTGAVAPGAAIEPLAGRPEVRASALRAVSLASVRSVGTASLLEFAKAVVASGPEARARAAAECGPLWAAAAALPEPLWPTAEWGIPFVWARLLGKAASRGVADALQVAVSGGTAAAGAARWALEAAQAVAAQAAVVDFAAGSSEASDRRQSRSGAATSLAGPGKPADDAVASAWHRLHATRAKLATAILRALPSTAAQSRREGDGIRSGSTSTAVEAALAPLLAVLEAASSVPAALNAQTGKGPEAALCLSSRALELVVATQARPATWPRSAGLGGEPAAPAAADGGGGDLQAAEPGLTDVASVVGQSADGGPCLSWLVGAPTLRLSRDAWGQPWHAVVASSSTATRATAPCAASLECRLLLIAADARAALRACLALDRHNGSACRSLLASCLATAEVLPSARAAVLRAASSGGAPPAPSTPGELPVLILDASLPYPERRAGTRPPPPSVASESASSPPLLLRADSEASTASSLPTQAAQRVQFPSLSTSSSGGSGGAPSPGRSLGRAGEAGSACWSGPAWGRVGPGGQSFAPPRLAAAGLHAAPLTSAASIQSGGEAAPATLATSTESELPLAPPPSPASLPRAASTDPASARTARGPVAASPLLRLQQASSSSSSSSSQPSSRLASPARATVGVEQQAGASPVSAARSAALARRRSARGSRAEDAAASAASRAPVLAPAACLIAEAMALARALVPVMATSSTPPGSQSDSAAPQSGVPAQPAATAPDASQGEALRSASVPSEPPSASARPLAPAAHAPSSRGKLQTLTRVWREQGTLTCRDWTVSTADKFADTQRSCLVAAVRACEAQARFVLPGAARSAPAAADLSTALQSMAALCRAARRLRAGCTAPIASLAREALSSARRLGGLLVDAARESAQTAGESSGRWQAPAAAALGEAVRLAEFVASVWPGLAAGMEADVAAARHSLLALGAVGRSRGSPVARAKRPRPLSDHAGGDSQPRAQRPREDAAPAASFDVSLVMESGP